LLLAKSIWRLTINQRHFVIISPEYLIQLTLRVNKLSGEKLSRFLSSIFFGFCSWQCKQINLIENCYCNSNRTKKRNAIKSEQ